MTSTLSPNTASNPMSLEPGVDLHTRTFLHNLFEAHRNTPGFNLDDWKDWTEAEQAGVIRALAQDYLDGHGRGHDWVSAGYQAEFVLASTYYEIAHNAQLSPAPVLNLNFYDPYMEEGFELQLAPPSDIAMDPVPGMAPAAGPLNSQRARAPLMLAPAGNCLEAVDLALVTGLRQLSEFFQATHRLPLMFMGAALTLWKSLQVSHHVRAGALFREITNPNLPTMPSGDMRILYARAGDHVRQAVDANPVEANLFLD